MVMREGPVSADSNKPDLSMTGDTPPPQSNEASLASALALAVAFASFVGWQHADAYYRYFGARWIAGELPQFAFLVRGWTTVTLLVPVLALTASTVFGGSGGAARQIGNRTFWVAIAATFALPLTSWLKPNPILHSVIAVLSASGCGILATTHFPKLRTAFESRNWTEVVTAGIFLYITLFQVPRILGESNARLDASPCHTTLPRVVVKDANERQYWALHIGSDRVYAVELTTEQHAPSNKKVEVVPWKAIETLGGEKPAQCKTPPPGPTSSNAPTSSPEIRSAE